MIGDIFDCHDLRVATGIWWTDAGYAAEHPMGQRTVPHYKELSVNSVIV